MVLIVRRENPWVPFVQGLSKGLERFGQMYQTQNALQSVGIPAEDAFMVSRMPVQLQQLWMKQNAPVISRMMQERQQVSNRPTFSSLMSQQQEMPMQEQMMQQEMPMQEPQMKKISVKRKKMLTPELVDAFLSRTNNDPKQARLLAKKYGYEV